MFPIKENFMKIPPKPNNNVTRKAPLWENDAFYRLLRDETAPWLQRHAFIRRLARVAKHAVIIASSSSIAGST